MIQHLLVSKSEYPNAFGARLPVITQLNISVWEFYLQSYHDAHVVDFQRFGWPVSYTAENLPTSSSSNHPSAVDFADHVEHYINTELGYHAIAGPFSTNPLHQPLICSPLQTVRKRGSNQRRVVMDLSYPPQLSVNSGITASSYLNEPYKLRLPSINRLCQFILHHGRGCLVYKKDLRRAYRQLPIDPKDCHLLGFTFNGRLYFDTRCPFGLRTSAMICQRTTSAVIYIFTQHGYTAYVYLDDFYGAERPDRAFDAFHQLHSLFDRLGLQASPEKDCPPATTMTCLGIEVDTNTFCLRVPRDRLGDLLLELTHWKARTSYRLKELQSLLGKLSFVTACVKSGRIFMSRLLNNLRAFPSSRRTAVVSHDMKLDIDWWLTFLPLFNGVSFIKSEVWSFDDFHFSTDACLSGGGATCQDQCFSVVFPPNILQEATHITALELFVVVVAIRAWAPLLPHHRFIVSCDNEAAATVINSGITRDPFMQRCLRQLWFTASLHDFEVRASFVPGDHNFLSF